VVIPPQVKLASNNLPNLGDPIHICFRTSVERNRFGRWIGSGSGGGVGVGTGPGVGEGRGGGVGGGVFHVAAESVRRGLCTSLIRNTRKKLAKAKFFSGTCVLWLVVGPDGRPRTLKWLVTLGLGLDEKAIEAVKPGSLSRHLKRR